MKTKITIICENSVYLPFPLIAEHGLAVLIEQDDTTLFDTGQGPGLLHNLKNLGKNSRDIKRVILSHGHYDHTGGLMPLLGEIGSGVPVYAHDDAFTDKRDLITTGADPVEVPIGMRTSKDDMEKAGAEFRNMSGFMKISDSISALSDVRRPRGWQTWDTRLRQGTGAESIPDPFNDDSSLIVETESGPVVLLGCAHAGVVEILDDLSERTGHKEFHAVIGGTHLDKAPGEYVERAIQKLREYNVKKIAVSHCTGFRIACRISGEFPDEFANASVGISFEF